jgi:hypothetical protein
MSVSSPTPQAAPTAYGAAVAPGRLALVLTWFRTGRANALALAFASGILGELVGGWGGRPLLLALPLTPFVSCAAGLLLGWRGIVAASLGQGITILAVSRDPLTAAVLTASLVLLGMAVHLIFRSVPKLGRGLPNLRSYLWLLASALFGGLVAALPGSLLAAQGDLSQQVWTRAAGCLISILLLAPPMLLLADRRLRPWIVPIPGETPARRVRRLADESTSLALPTGEETVVLDQPRSEVRRQDLLIGAGMVLGITVLVVPVIELLPQTGGWLRLFYLIPILWAALSFGLRGAVLAASASGLLYLLGLSWMMTASQILEVPYALWSDYAGLLALALAGAFVGRSREREVLMREELIEANRLLRRDLLRVAQAFTEAVHAKDAYTEGHLRRVSEYAVTVGERLGLRGQALEMLHYASMLHDVGKLGVPEQVLSKPGPLDHEEAEAMRRHPEIGARMLEKLDLLSGAAPLVLHHQERYDGLRYGEYPGYPSGLSGERIPLGARIIAVVDAFDAMTTSRPYRRALPVEHAASVLREERGRQFDPRVVDAFLELLAERPWR